MGCGSCGVVLVRLFVGVCVVGYLGRNQVTCNKTDSDTTQERVRRQRTRYGNQIQQQIQRQRGPGPRGQYDSRQIPNRHLITVTFINKSGRQVNMFQSDRNQFEVLFQFTLRPNEPRTIRFYPDNSFWVAYDRKTHNEMSINRRRRFETYWLQTGRPYDARIHTNMLPPEKYPRGKIPPIYVRTLVILDDSMIQHYGDKVIHFTLSLMNVAARSYHHPSLGIPVIVAVVGMELMEQPPPYYKVIPNQPQMSGGGGCRYAQQFKAKYNFTFAITLTKRDIGPAGYAPMYTMCTNRSCALVQVSSLDSGYVIAHELGHALGIDHDEADGCGNRRNARGGNIMARKMFSTSSNFKWSKCSGRMLRQNLKYFKCMREKPAKMLQAFRDSMQGFPGEYFNATMQCQQFHNNQTTACETNVMAGNCRYLLCKVPGNLMCRPSRWHAPLEGTTCGKTKKGWCIHGVCRNKAMMMPVHGQWNSWSEFKPQCNESSSTLLLLQTRTRNCTNPRPRNGGRRCKGDNVDYRVVVPYESGMCRPYTLKNLITRRQHQNFQNRLGKLLGKDNATTKFDAMMFPCTSSKAKGKDWTEFPAPKQAEYLMSKNFSCDFEQRGCSWRSSLMGKKHWTLKSGPTPSRGTGPSFDHTLKNAKGKYIYLEASYVENTPSMRGGDRIIFESPLILSSAICLRFAYHMFGPSMGSIEVNVRNGKYARMMWSKKGDQGDKWHTTEINLDLNIEYNITIEAVRGKSYNSDIAIDDISVTQGLCTNKKKQVEKDKCTSVCVDTELTSMLRLQLPNGTPCRNEETTDSVCIEKACMPVNCRGTVGGPKC